MGKSKDDLFTSKVVMPCLHLHASLARIPPETLSQTSILQRKPNKMELTLDRKVVVREAVA